MSFAAGFVRQGTGDEGFAAAGRAGDDDVLVMLDPVARAELVDQRAFQSAGRTEVEVFDAGGLFQSGVSRAGGQRAVLPPKPLAFDQQTEAFIKGQFSAARLGTLFIVGFGHAVELHGIEFDLGRFVQHGDLLWVGVWVTGSNGRHAGCCASNAGSFDRSRESVPDFRGGNSRHTNGSLPTTWQRLHPKLYE